MANLTVLNPLKVNSAQNLIDDQPTLRKFLRDTQYGNVWEIVSEHYELAVLEIDYYFKRFRIQYKIE